MMKPVIQVLPGTEASARAILGQALEEVKDGDVAFVVIISGDDAHILSSAFKTRDISWASQMLNGYAIKEAIK